MLFREGTNQRIVEYEIKWVGQSYLHNTWHTADELAETKGHRKLFNYKRRKELFENSQHEISPEDIEQEKINEELRIQRRKRYIVVDRVIAQREGEDGGPAYFVKWDALSYEHCTWESVNGEIWSAS